MAKYDVLIIGAGIIGSAVFDRLSADGMRCLLLDRHRVGLGATGYSGAMVRLAHADLNSVVAAGAGMQRYTAFEAESAGRARLSRCGHLYFAPEVELRLILPHVQAYSAAAQILDRDEINRRFLDMDVTADSAIFEPQAGFADPIAFARHHVGRGLDGGGHLAEATRLTHLLIGDGRVQGAATSAGRVTAAWVVLALGAQTPSVLASHGLPAAGLWAQKIQVAKFVMSVGTVAWPGLIDDQLGLNGLPGPGPGLYYLGLPTGLRSWPDAGACSADPAHSDKIRVTAAHRLPQVANATAQGAMCHSDCYSPRPIGDIGPLVGGPDGLCLATGFSGGGFKMAPYAADRVAEMLA